MNLLKSLRGCPKLRWPERGEQAHPKGVPWWKQQYQLAMSEGRSFYPGYRYYSYPHYGTTQFSGGGYHYFAPGYYYPRQQ